MLSRPIRIRACIASAVLATAFFFPSRAWGHGALIGHTAAGQLVARVEVPMPVEVPPSVYPGITGYAGVEPGIASAELDEPAEDLFRLAENCNIQFEVIAFDPGVQIVSDHVWVVGETAVFGPPFFDFHLVFNIPGGPTGVPYSLQFRLHDLAGVYSDSDIVTLQFAAVETACHCRGDLNADDVRDGRDIQSFVNCMTSAVSGEPLVEACHCADMDGDGALDDVDIDHFIEHLLAGEACHP